MDAFVSPDKVIGDTFAPVPFCPLSYPLFCPFQEAKVERRKNGGDYTPQPSFWWMAVKKLWLPRRTRRTLKSSRLRCISAP